MNIDEIRTIEKEMVRILPIFLNEFIDFVSYETRDYITSLLRQNRAFQLIGFDNGLGAWTDERKIYFAIQNKNMFEKLAKKPEYGQNKGMKLVSNDNFVDNDKDYIDYMNYVVANGLSELDYCLDLLPHQVMHLIGCKGGIFGEGITELRTRQVCEKYGIRCAPVLHSKETKLIKLMEEFIDKMIINESGFWGDFCMLEEALEKRFGEKEFKSIYEDLCIDYRIYASDRSRDPFEHYNKYREIDFSKIFELIETKRDSKIEA